MRLLIVHHETKYFAGAERMLGYFVDGLASAGASVTVALVQGSRMDQSLPATVPRVWLPPNDRFSPWQFFRQVRALVAAQQKVPFDVIHGWAARDWELTAAVSRLVRRPALGTLHDHPGAGFISPYRRWLMRCCANRGLQRLVCVSHAVEAACVQAGYPADKLSVIHNGLPGAPALEIAPAASAVCRLGFIGAFSQRKGLHGLFEVLDELEKVRPGGWNLSLAGSSQDGAGEKLVRGLQEQFGRHPWWPRIQWLGWVDQPAEFLAKVDCLVVPSIEFDPLPTVLLEAGRAGIPALAARVGGVAEIVEDGRTGWLFEAGDWRAAATRLAAVMGQGDRMVEAGEMARRRIGAEFSVAKMVLDYQQQYVTLLNNVK